MVLAGIPDKRKKRKFSGTLIASGKHLQSDTITTLGVVMSFSYCTLLHIGIDR